MLHNRDNPWARLGNLHLQTVRCNFFLYIAMPFLILALLSLGVLTTGCSQTASVEITPVGVTDSNAEIIVPRVESEAATFRVVRLASGLVNPWGVAFLPDGRFLVTERAGKMILIEGNEKHEVSGLPAIRARNQGGLLDVVVHPDYANNGWIYFTYSAVDPAQDNATGTALARAKLTDRALTDLEVLYTMAPLTTDVHHYGSRILFLPDGTLLFTIGDRGRMNRAQDLNDPAGSVLRLNADGSIPADNPFVGRDGVRPEIYTFGNRNGQGLALDPGTGAIWQTEHGPRGGDELNLIRPGVNYGWPVVSLGNDYVTNRPIGVREQDGMEPPTWQWTPSIGVSGTMFYSGTAFPGWQGSVFAGGLALQRLVRVVMENGRPVRDEILLQGVVGRVRDVKQGPDGLVYLLNDQQDGGLFRLEPVQ